MGLGTLIFCMMFSYILGLALCFIIFRKDWSNGYKEGYNFGYSMGYFDGAKDISNLYKEVGDDDERS